VISVDPVQNVKCSVRSLGKQIVRSDCFGFSGLGNEKELRENGYSFKVNREGPQDFDSVELSVDETGKSGSRDNEELSAH